MILKTLRQPFSHIDKPSIRNLEYEGCIDIETPLSSARFTRAYAPLDCGVTKTCVNESSRRSTHLRIG
jgi:hypothetical protein